MKIAINFDNFAKIFQGILPCDAVIFRNFAEIFSIGKPESLGYCAALFIVCMIPRLDNIQQADGWTDNWP